MEEGATAAHHPPAWPAQTPMCGAPEASEQRQPTAEPTESDGRQAGHGCRSRGPRPRVLRLVRSLPRGRARSPPAEIRGRASWLARPASPRRAPKPGRRKMPTRPPGYITSLLPRRASCSTSLRVPPGKDRWRGVAKRLQLEKGAHGVAGILAWPGRYSRRPGRALPIATEGRADGGTDYYMDPELAELFNAVRASSPPSPAARHRRER